MSIGYTHFSKQSVSGSVFIALTKKSIQIHPFTSFKFHAFSYHFACLHILLYYAASLKNKKKTLSRNDFPERGDLVRNITWMVGHNLRKTARHGTDLASKKYFPDVFWERIHSKLWCRWNMQPNAEDRVKNNCRSALHYYRGKAYLQHFLLISMKYSIRQDNRCSKELPFLLL